MKVKTHFITTPTSSGLSKEITPDLSQNMTQDAYIEETNRTVRLHQTAASSKRTAQRQHKKKVTKR